MVSLPPVRQGATLRGSQLDSCVSKQGQFLGNLLLSEAWLGALLLDIPGKASMPKGCLPLPLFPSKGERRLEQDSASPTSLHPPPLSACEANTYTVWYMALYPRHMLLDFLLF